MQWKWVVMCMCVMGIDFVCFYDSKSRSWNCSDSVVFCVFYYYCSSFLVFCVVLVCVFTFVVTCCHVHYDFRIKQCSVRLYFQLFVGVLMSYLRYLCLFTYSGVQHILHCVFCFVCLRLVLCVPNVPSISGLSILDCPFGFLGHLFMYTTTWPLDIDLTIDSEWT